MYHRIVYEYVYGSIPEGYEINHKCHNRACCNLSHLECIDGTDHAVLTNEERYKERSVAMKDYWIKTKCTGTFLGERFGVSFSTACKHIREWR